MTSAPLVLAMAVLGGLIAGSFFNVCIHRLPRRESIVAPRSRCPNCLTTLRWWENVPIVSWLLQRGRCRTCGTAISWIYPVVELATAAVVVLVVLWTPPGPLVISRLVLAGTLIVLFFIDLTHRILPNVVTLPGIVFGWLFSFVAPPGPVGSAIGIVLGGGVLYAIAAGYYLVRKEEGMGMGDVKMLALIGAFLGWQGVLLTLILSSVAGAVFGIVLVAFTRADMRYALPFGSFLAVAGLVAMLGGDAILDWYLRLA